MTIHNRFNNTTLLLGDGFRKTFQELLLKAISAENAFNEYINKAINIELASHEQRLDRAEKQNEITEIYDGLYLSCMDMLLLDCFLLMQPQFDGVLKWAKKNYPKIEYLKKINSKKDLINNIHKNLESLANKRFSMYKFLLEETKYYRLSKNKTFNNRVMIKTDGKREEIALEHFRFKLADYFTQRFGVRLECLDYPKDFEKTYKNYIAVTDTEKHRAALIYSGRIAAFFPGMYGDEKNAIIRKYPDIEEWVDDYLNFEQESQRDVTPQHFNQR